MGQIFSFFGLLLHTSFGAWGRERHTRGLWRNHMVPLLCDTVPVLVGFDYLHPGGRHPSRHT